MTDDRQKAAAGGVGGMALGVFVTWAWNAYAASRGYPEMTGEVGAAVGGLVGPIYVAVLEIVGAFKNMLIRFAHGYNNSE